MTCIVYGVKTKKELKDRVNQKQYRGISVEDPSVFKPWGPVRIDKIPEKIIVVTNHPRRTWFAQVKVTDTGIKVT